MKATFLLVAAPTFELYPTATVEVSLCDKDVPEGLSHPSITIVLPLRADEDPSGSRLLALAAAKRLINEAVLAEWIESQGSNPAG